MKPIASLDRRFPLVTFFLIAYATSFVGGYLSEVYPSYWWALFVYGPCIGAFIVTAIGEGRAGLKVWLGRIARWRVGLQWYIVVLLLPVVLQLLALGVNRVLGGTMSGAAQSPDPIPVFVFCFLFIGLAEEPGFRGFALPRLLVGRSALVASLILGVLHTIWHLPLFVSGSESLVIIPIILSGAILFTWIYLHTQGSVLLAMLLHSSVNTAQVWFSALLSDSARAQQLTLLAVLYVATALILVAVNGPSLTRNPAGQPAEMNAIFWPFRKRNRSLEYRRSDAWPKFADGRITIACWTKPDRTLRVFMITNGDGTLGRWTEYFSEDPYEMCWVECTEGASFYDSEETAIREIYSNYPWLRDVEPETRKVD